MMKTLLCSLSLACTALAGEVVQTQAILPDNKLLWPMPEKAAGIEVIAEFKSDETIFGVTQGNWERTEHRLTYTVSSPVEGFPLTEFSFICSDSNPTPESGIRVKKMAWPFREGRMKFTLERDSSVRHTPYFKILRYEPVAEKK